MQTRENEKIADLRVIKSNNLGTFYNNVYKRISYKSGIGALIDNAGIAIVNDKEKENVVKLEHVSFMNIFHR
jgi:hypothetical protein